MATRRATRTSNAKKHPGEIVNEQKQKRRTKEEMAHDRQVAKEKKEAKALEQQKKHDMVASVEHQIEEKDKADHTNPPRRIHLRRRTAYALLPETISSDEDREATPQPQPVRRAKRDNDYELEFEPTDIEDEHPKKKNKSAKTNVREAITASRNMLARSGTVMIVDKEVTKAGAKTANPAANFVSEPLKPSGTIKNWAASVSSGYPSKGSIPTSTRSSSTVVTSSGKTFVESASGANNKNHSLEAVDLVDSDIEIHHGWTAGGFEDEDEGEEQEAARSSPIKGNQRLTSTGMIKIEDDLRTPVKKAPKNGRVVQVKVKNENLPAGAKPNWRSIYVPTYLQFVASYGETWMVDDQEAVVAMQKVWNAVYPKIAHNVSVRDPVFTLATQKVNEWRGGIGSAALAIVNSFFEHEKELFNTDEKRCQFAKDTITSLSFLYEDTDDPKKFRGLFRSPFVTQTFSAHLDALKGSIAVPNLLPTEKSWPEGALALSAAAVERAFTLWASSIITIASVRSAEKENKGNSIRAMLAKKGMNQATGRETSSAGDFDKNNWGTAAQKYMVSVKALRPNSWDQIMMKAKEYSKLRGRGSGSKLASVELQHNEPEDDHRALLLDVSDED